MKKFIIVTLCWIVLLLGQKAEFGKDSILYSGFVNNRIVLIVKTNSNFPYPLYIQHSQQFLIDSKKYQAFLEDSGDTARIEEVK